VRERLDGRNDELAPPVLGFATEVPMQPGDERPVPPDASKSAWLVVVATIVTLFSAVVVGGSSLVSFFRDPGNESLVVLTIGVAAAASSVALGHAARRRSRPRGASTVVLAVGYSMLVLSVAAYAAPAVQFAIARWRTPPNYQLTFELQGTARRPVDEAMIDQFKATLASNFRRLRVPYEFGDGRAPRVIVRMRAMDGVDMPSRFEGQPMTIHLVHDRSDALLAATSREVAAPEGWKVVGKGEARLLVQVEPLLVDGVQSADVTVDLNSKSAVHIAFRPDSRAQVVKAMREHRGRRLALVVGDELFGAPRVEGEPRNDGAIVIGGLDPLEANDLALGMRMGMYPAAFRVVEGHYLRP
jgi:hypothetical protein